MGLTLTGCWHAAHTWPFWPSTSIIAAQTSTRRERGTGQILISQGSGQCCCLLAQADQHLFCCGWPRSPSSRITSLQTTQDNQWIVENTYQSVLVCIEFVLRMYWNTTIHTTIHAQYIGYILVCVTRHYIPAHDMFWVGIWYVWNNDTCKYRPNTCLFFAFFFQYVPIMTRVLHAITYQHMACFGLVFGMYEIMICANTDQMHTFFFQFVPIMTRIYSPIRSQYNPILTNTSPNTNTDQCTNHRF